MVAILEQPDSAAMLMQGDREGNTPFLLAAREGRLDAILKMADVWDGDLMQLWTQGNSRRVTPMHAACANDHLDIVEVALEHLQEIDEDRRHLLFTMQDSKDQTPLHSASASQSEAVHSILEQVEQNDPSKIRALVTCADSEQETPLHIACQEGCLDHVSVSTARSTCLRLKLLVISNKQRWHSGGGGRGWDRGWNGVCQ